MTDEEPEIVQLPPDHPFNEILEGILSGPFIGPGDPSYPTRGGTYER